MTRAPRRRRRRALAVDVIASLGLVGRLVMWVSPAFLVPALVALGYGEPAWPFVAAGATAVLVGLGLRRAARGRKPVGVREGYLVVALVWLLVAAFGALPYVFTRSVIDSPLDAFYESMSGFTTTGATVVRDPAHLGHALAFWRQLTVWLGGLGIVVLALAVLPKLRVGGRQLLEAEAAGDVGSLAETIRDTSRRFLLLYVGLTAFAIAVLLAVGWSGLDDTLTPYDAIVHAIVTPATGGFSPEVRSVEGFDAATQWALVGLMILGGTNFALMWRSLTRRRPGLVARDEEFRLYVALLAIGALLLVGELIRANVYSGEAAIRHAVFQSVSIMTTTGFASADYALWPPAATAIIVSLMFIGASAGSTSGSIKVVRHVVVGRMLGRELAQTVHPELVRPLRLNGRVVDDRALRAVIVFVLLYLGLFALGALALVLDAARTGADLTPYGAIAAAAATISNTGPGLGPAGPMGSYADFSDVSKSVMIALMWLGRLEIVPVVVLLTRSYWRE